MTYVKNTLAVMAIGVLSSVSLIASPFLTFNEATGGSGTNQGQSVGWQFDVLTAITVNELGWYDQNQDGLGHSHTVGIWNSGGTLLTSVLVPAGTAAGLDGMYRMVGISPILLPVGTGYVVGGENFSTSGDRLADNVTQTVDSKLNYVHATFSNLGAGFTDPTNFSTASDGFYGPMMGGTAAVPEPATIFLGGSGLLIATVLRRRLQRH